jgi:hypothetical protein
VGTDKQANKETCVSCTVPVCNFLQPFTDLHWTSCWHSLRHHKYPCPARHFYTTHCTTHWWESLTAAPGSLEASVSLPCSVQLLFPVDFTAWRNFDDKVLCGCVVSHPWRRG